MQTSRVFLPAVVAALTFAVSLQASSAAGTSPAGATAPVRPEIYAPVTLTADLASLTAKEREMVSLFIDASVIMDELFWRQAYPGDRARLLAIGQELNHDVADVIGIVTPQTYSRWVDVLSLGRGAAYRT